MVSRTIALAMAKPLTGRNPQYNLDHIELNSSWTTGKTKSPEGAKKEGDLLYLQDTLLVVKTHKIPSYLEMSLGQTLLK